MLETVKMAAHMEEGYVRGKCVVAVLWDAEKFFDSLDISTLVSRALNLGFPPEVMILGLQIHRAPRVLKALDSLTNPLPRTGRSIIAGCTLSTSFARAYIHTIISALSNIPGQISYQRVDDIDLITQAGKVDNTVSRTIRGSKAFVQSARESGLGIFSRPRLFPLTLALNAK